MKVKFWLFLVVLVWAIIMTVFLFFRNPLPFPDRGHRCFAVPSEEAVKIVESITAQYGLPERFTFDAGPTHQTLLWDNTTVLIRFDSVLYKSGLGLNAISLVSSDPLGSAKGAVDLLRYRGFDAKIHENIDPELGDKLVFVESNAFEGWVMVFRRHILAMGSPPNKRKISEK